MGENVEDDIAIDTYRRTDFCSLVYSNLMGENVEDDIAIDAGYGPRKDRRLPDVAGR
jgi:hypothetical protein